MSGEYLVWLADELRAAGLAVVEYQGWQTRARSSGGYAAAPLCVMWHHTASDTTPANDAAYMCDGSTDRPIANLLIARTGQVWVLAAGATNTNGKGGPLTFSRGTVPVDGMNTRAVGAEIASTGVGEIYPAAQVDAMFVVSNVIGRRLGNRPDDLAGHWDWAPTRKIDPAVNVTSSGWAPRRVTTSGTWDVADMRAEATRRAEIVTPDPTPTPDPDPEEDDVRLYVVLDPTDGTSQYVTDMATFKTPIPSPGVSGEGIALFGWQAMDGDPYGLGAGWAPFLEALPVTAPWP